MLLRSLINGLEVVDQSGNMDCDVTSVAYDSRKVKKGSLFVCIDGTTVDGHDYIDQAVKSGAVAFLVSKPCIVPDNCTMIRIEDTRYGLAYVADKYFEHPTGKLPLIGVTGTKGKTTTAFMIKNILEVAGKKVGLIGTIQNMIGDEILYTERTTPESLDLQGLFVDMLEKGMDYAVMEVSSQGLMLSRVACCEFKLGIFTNIESDHIGPNEHKDFEDYFSQKLKLFSMCHKALVNADIPQANDIIKVCPEEYMTYGVIKGTDPTGSCMGTDPATSFKGTDPATSFKGTDPMTSFKGTDPMTSFKGTDITASKIDITASKIKAYPDCVIFHVNTPWWEDDITLSVPGHFNVSNALAAIGTCCLVGIDKEAIKIGLANFKVKGRTEIVLSNDRYTVMIDYAHNAMSLESLLKSIREYANGRIVCLFGCGGNRDSSRRYEMGEVSGRYADYTIITSDNPRNEDPDKIISDIEIGMLKTDGIYTKITQRRDAMKFAIETAQLGDFIIFAGKGHETYQIFKDKQIHFDEREIVAEIMKELNEEATS